MSAFLDLFRGEQIDFKAGRPIWITLSPLRYRSDRLDVTVIVPAELVTDLASVPRLPLLWLAAGGRGTRSATLHDFAYQFGFWWVELPDGKWWQQYVSRMLADDVFYESLLADPISGAGAVRAWEMWLAVRLGGRGIWSDSARALRFNPIWSGGGWEAP